MAVTKITERFTDKKSRFNNYTTHPEIFDCDDFNVIKLFQYAIFREQGFNARAYWHLPFFIISCILFLKRLRIKCKKKYFSINPQKEILIADSHRTIKDNAGKLKSRYFQNILNVLDKKKILWINATPYHSSLTYDVSFNDFYEGLSTLPLTNDDKRILNHLKLTYYRVVSELKINANTKRIFKEIIQIFWQEYRTYRTILEHYPNLKVAFVFPHYQKESLIYALKRKSVKVIELQHGLIAEEDMFYIYNKNIVKVKDKALFADEMWVYGEYWKNVLLKGYEYDETQIKIFGYYLFYQKDFSAEFGSFARFLKSNYSTIIFITLQKNLEHLFAEYINFLMKDSKEKKQNISVIIKPHPSATQDILNYLDGSWNNFYVVDYPLEWLFQICDIHLSIYSTTLFDALMFGVKNNFAIRHPLFEDYVESIVNKGIAKELQMNENVLDIFQNKDITMNELAVEYFYAPMNENMLIKLI